MNLGVGGHLRYVVGVPRVACLYCVLCSAVSLLSLGNSCILVIMTRLSHNMVISRVTVGLNVCLFR